MGAAPFIEGEGTVDALDQLRAMPRREHRRNAGGLLQICDGARDARGSRPAALVPDVRNGPVLLGCQLLAPMVQLPESGQLSSRQRLRRP